MQAIGRQARRALVGGVLALAALLMSLTLPSALRGRSDAGRCGDPARVQLLGQHHQCHPRDPHALLLARRLPGAAERPALPADDLRRLRRARPPWRDGRAPHRRPKIISVFRRAYNARFPIYRMRLVDDYRGSDDASMAANNTSAFNCRRTSGGTAWSQHSYGRAIDINPVQNPYVSGGVVEPPAGKAYVARSPLRKGMVTWTRPRRVRGHRVVLGRRLALQQGLPALLEQQPLSLTHRNTWSGQRASERTSDLDALRLIGPHGDLDPVPRAELVHQAGQVRLDGAEADVQLIGDLGVGVAPSDGDEDLFLPRGQGFDRLGRRLVRCARPRTQPAAAP